MLFQHHLTVFHKASCDVTDCLGFQSSSAPINVQWGLTSDDCGGKSMRVKTLMSLWWGYSAQQA